MLRHRIFVLAAAAVTLTLAPPASAQAQTGDSATARIDTAAMNALTRMGTYLRTLKAFQVKANVETEDVMEDGEKVQRANRVDLVAERPNKMRVQLASDAKQRLFLFDGTDFTLFAPRQNFYATVPAPGTIADLVKMLEDKYDIEMPFVDLFRWGTSDAQTDAITDATVIGPSEVEGVTCEQYAFRQAGLDWQLWVQLGDYPLPRKIVLTTLTDDARPQHESIYTWNLAPSFSDESFEFEPPKDAKKITIADANAMRLKERANAKKTGGQDK